MLRIAASRGAELVAHVAQEPALEVGQLPELFRPVVQLGVEREHALVGLEQLVLQPVDLRLLHAHRLGEVGDPPVQVARPRLAWHRLAHGFPRTASMPTSSRPRRKSRYIRAATTAG